VTYKEVRIGTFVEFFKFLHNSEGRLSSHLSYVFHNCCFLMSLLRGVEYRQVQVGDKRGCDGFHKFTVQGGGFDSWKLSIRLINGASNLRLLR
jgi:hypothetical protein